VFVVPKSVLDAVKLGLWDYEPPEVAPEAFDSSDAMPGTAEKLDVLAERLASGLPLWHQDDRRDMGMPGASRGSA
jgi:hypothetical protein